MQELRQADNPGHEAFLHYVVPGSKGMCRGGEIRAAYEGYDKVREVFGEL